VQLDLLPAGLKAADPVNWPVATDVEQLPDEVALTVMLRDSPASTEKPQVLAFAIWIDDAPGTIRAPTIAIITPIGSIDLCTIFGYTMSVLKKNFESPETMTCVSLRQHT
jgi:hypothetical protein